MACGQWGHVVWEELLASAEGCRDLHYRALFDVLQSPSYHRFLLQLAAWVASRRWRSAMEPGTLDAFQKPVKTVIDGMLAKGHKRIRKRYAAAGGDVDALHAVRIAVKNQRYAVEFFRDLYPRKKLARYRNAARDLQDVLGHLNDATVVEGFLNELDGVAREPAVTGFVSGWYAREGM